MQYLEDDFYKLIGENIRTRRQSLNISQAGLAKKVGLRRTSITNIESGQQKIQIYTLFLISGVLNSPIYSLLPSRDSQATDKKQLFSSQKVMTNEGKKKELSDSDLDNIMKVIR